MTRSSNNTPFYLTKIHNSGDGIRISLKAAYGPAADIEITVKGHVSIKPATAVVDRTNERLDRIIDGTNWPDYTKEIARATGPHSAVVNDVTHLSTSPRQADFAPDNDGGSNIESPKFKDGSALADMKLKGYTEGLIAGMVLAQELIQNELRADEAQIDHRLIVSEVYMDPQVETGFKRIESFLSALHGSTPERIRSGWFNIHAA